MKTVWVTGALGFIGFQLSKFLKINYSYKIVGIGRNSKNQKIDYNIFSDFYVTEINNATDFENYPIPDILIHCADISSIYSSENKTDMLLNENPFESVLNAAFVANKDCKVLLLSSPSAGILKPYEQLKEGMNFPFNPINKYGQNKSESERAALKLFNKGHDIKIIKIFSVYGPNQKKQIVFDAIRKIQSDSPFFLGTGKEIRDFIYIDDLLYILSYLILNQVEGLIHYVGSGVTISIENLLLVISEIIGYKKTLIFDNINKGFVADNLSMDKNLLFLPRGFEPVSLLYGLKKTILLNNDLTDE